jgi:hypothetical protein
MEHCMMLIPTLETQRFVFPNNSLDSESHKSAQPSAVLINNNLQKNKNKIKRTAARYTPFISVQILEAMKAAAAGVSTP